MKGRSPLSARVHGALLKMLAPSLGEERIREARALFLELRQDALARGRGAYLTFLGRELRAVISTALALRREARDEGEGGGAGWTDPFRQDLGYALRKLSRSPGFVTVTVLSLSVAIAVSTIVFSVVNAALLRPTPHVAHQEELVRVFTGTRGNHRGPMSYPDYRDLRDRSGTLQDVAAVGSRNFAVGPAAEGTRQIWGLEVSENYFQLLGIPLALGRGFLPEDVASGGRVVVIGHNTWQRTFEGDPDVLGKTLVLNGQAYTVVGVGPRGMVAMDGPRLLEVVVPIMDFREERGRWALRVVGRMEGGTTLPQVQAEMDAIAGALQEEYPNYWNHSGQDPTRLQVLSARDARVPEGAPLAALLGGVGALVGLIMLIACSNVANLLLTRAFRRRTEIAIRSAIGAPAGRVFGQLLTENLLLFGAAGVLGLLATWWAASILQSGGSLIPPPGLEIQPDGRVALFALCVALGTGLTFGLLPALNASRPDLVRALKGMTPVLRFRLFGVRNLLVGAQVGGSLVLVLVTLLLVKSLSRARTLDPGFDPRGVATLEVDVSHRDYTEAEGVRFFQDLLARVESARGVESAGYADWVPLAGGSISFGGLEPEGYERGPQEHVQATMAVVSPEYLEMAGMRLLRGRDFGAEDRADGPQVVLVNQAFVDRYWPGESGLGKRIGTREGKEEYQVVGVVADVSYRELASEPGPHLWFPLAQAYRSDLILHARTEGDPRALLPVMRRLVAELDPDLPVIRVDLMDRISANATRPQEVLSAVLGVVGLLALGLAMLGIYGVVAYSVGQRTREMGLRMALGAEPKRVMGLVLGEGLTLSLIGLVPGLLVALAASRLLRAALLGMDPLDPAAFGAGLGIMFLAVLGASLAPGIRASRADPAESLRWQ